MWTIVYEQCLDLILKLQTRGMSNYNLKAYYYNNHLTIHNNILYIFNIKYYFYTLCTKVWTRMQADSVPTTHAGVDHVRSLCSCCLDCLEDVHSSFNFDPLNFSHTSDKHTTAGHAITGKIGKMNAYTLESCANMKDYMQNLTPSCKSTTSIYM